MRMNRGTFGVAFQGELGAFSEEAVRTYFGDAAVPVPCREFGHVADAVSSEAARYGMLPIENTLAGSVVGSYDVLARTDLIIVGEVIRPIRHCVLGLEGATLGDVRRVISHPVALAQCERFLASHALIEAVAVYDTAGAARQVAEAGDPGQAAIASRAAAGRYGLVPLAEDVQDRADNQTRFVIVARPGDGPPPPPQRDAGRAPAMKTALLIETRNRPGALVDVLLPFARRGINLSKLESRPGERPWSYRFFLELEAAAEAPETGEALEEIRARAAALRVLGSFAAWRAH